MAPELFEFSEVDVYASDHAMARMQKSDIYAFGSLYYEVSTNTNASALAKYELHRFITTNYPLLVNLRFKSWCSFLKECIRLD